MKPPSLRQIKGRWYAYFSDARRSPSRKSVPLGDTTERKAQSAANKLHRDWIAGTFDPWQPLPSSLPALTLPELVERYVTARGVRDTTATTYKRVFLELERLHGFDALAAALTSATVARYVTDPTAAEATRAKRYRHVRAVCKWAKEAGLLLDDPTEAVQRPKEGRVEAAFLSTAEVQQLVTCIEQDYEAKAAKGQAQPGQVLWLRDVLLFAVSTGFRLGEVRALRWRDVDLAHSLVTVRNRSGFRSKSGDDRTIPLAGDALRVIERLHAERRAAQGNIVALDAPVFMGEGGGMLNPNMVSRRFKHYVREAKLPEHYHFHSLRHTCASWLVMKGVPLQVVQRILGHSTSRVTERYAHLSPDVLKAAMQQAFGS